MYRLSTREHFGAGARFCCPLLFESVIRIQTGAAPDFLSLRKKNSLHRSGIGRTRWGGCKVKSVVSDNA